MFQFAGSKNPESKCYVTHGILGHLDPKQPPVKRKPFASILAVPFIHKAELILPKELYEVIKSELSAKFPTPSFSRVILPLSVILEGEFFNEYVKKGNVLMLSEGQRGITNMFSLKDGLLTLSLDKDTYERAGIVGKPEGSKGKRGTRPRWIVEINLRLPSMFHGKKGFDRIVYAFKNALTMSVTWLFVNLGEVISPDPLAKHFPVSVECYPKISPSFEVAMPLLQPPQEPRGEYRDEFCDFAVEIYEWLSMITLESPRVTINDQIDPFLSRYVPPSADSTDTEGELIMITWEGLMPASWVHKVFVEVLLTATPNTWLSLVVSSFADNLPTDSRDCMVLKLPGASNGYMMWEVEQ